ncbi:TetR family transcriptional regulator [Luteimonas sp. MC1782]|uniref:TetR family transcriptional regulator n=1 Tax=Luteimonas sp. MC1782 TaxID=2760305 RepID=UPI00160316A0|nr:TetR family transcriptional regulator [Luteimonas sp. MC1782]MBB1473509.1 TetR family transcriptional regulator [Luteimonas sp. MC1782]
MARKTKEEALVTREGILDAAEACFREHGMSRTSLEAIAVRAGVTRGAVYWHFKNKTEVLEAVISRVTVPFLHGLEYASRPEGSTPLADLREMLRASFADVVDKPHVRNAIEVIELRCEITAETTQVHDLRQSGFRNTHARINAAFQRAEDLGQLRAGMNAHGCAMALHFMISGVMRAYLVDPDNVDLQRDGMAAVDLALGAMATAAARLPRD